MSKEENYFTITRESIGLEPIIKNLDQTNANHKIKNCGLKFRECQKFLQLTDTQIRNAIKIKVLKSVIIGDLPYICIASVMEVKESQELIEKIIDEDEITTNIAAKILEMTSKNVRRLIEEGYLTVTGTFDFKYGTASLVKRGEVRKLQPQILEIKEFWKSQAKINRQLGAKKAAKKRLDGFKKENTFKDKLFTKFENTPYKQAKLIKACFSLLSLEYYIERKLDKNIVDKELIDLRTEAINKLTGIYQGSDYLKIYFVQGDKYINYCSECIKNVRQSKNEFYYSRYGAVNAVKNLKEPCNKCEIDNDYFSVVFFYIQIFEYTFLLNTLYREVKDWLSLENTPHKKISFLQLEEDKGLIENIHINKNQLKSFKIYEVISYLKEFINSKDLDLSMNI